MAAPQPTPTASTQPTPSPTPDPTADWKSYNLDLYTIKLPSGWNHQNTTGDPIKFTSEKLQIEIHQEKTALSLPDFVAASKENTVGLWGEEIGWQQEEIAVNQQKAIRVTFQKPLSNYVLYYFKNEPISTAAAIAFSLDFKNNPDLTNQILSTFKFLDQETIPAISTEELSLGWYYGQKDQKKPNTPANWIYTEAGRSSCWHEPNTQCGFLPD